MVLVVPYEQPWWIRYYVVVWCRRDITVTTLTAAATQTLFLFLFTDASSASASHCTFSKIKRTTKKKEKQFLCSEILGQEQSLRVCLFVCFLVFEFYFWLKEQRNEEREIFWGFGMYVCFCFVLLLAFGNYGVEQPTVRLALLSKRSYTCAVKLLLYFTAPPASQVGFFFFFYKIGFDSNLVYINLFFSLFKHYKYLYLWNDHHTKQIRWCWRVVILVFD